MVAWLVVTIVALSGGLVLLAGFLALRGSGLTLSPIVLAAAAEVALLGQAVTVLVKLAAGERPESTGLVLSYLAGVVFLAPVGVFWALGERSRWGNVVLVVTGLSMATMTVRLWDLWLPLT